MADKPTEVTGWATTTVSEPVTVGGSEIFVTNVVEPTQEIKNSGILAREPLARPYFNWIVNFLSRWIENLDTRTSVVGSVQITTDATRTTTDYDNEFGGTWTQLSNDTLGGATVYIFERTA